MKRFLNIAGLFFLLLVSGVSSAQKFERIGAQYKGVQLARDRFGEEFLVNKHNISLSPEDSIRLPIKELIGEINTTKLSKEDQLLVVRTLDMISGYDEQLAELKNLARTFPEIDRLLIIYYYEALQKRMGTAQLRKAIKQKKRT